MTTSPNRNRIAILIALMLVGGIFVAISVQQSGREQRVPITYPPGAVVHGGTYGEWIARHWQWIASIPLDTNPGYDVTGQSCGDGQTGPVFFLPRNLPPCKVPAGMAILVPIAGSECSSTELPPFSGTNEEELRFCAAEEVDRYTNIRLSVDGRDVPEIEAYRTSSPLFALSLPDHNILGAPTGVAYAVADGYQAILRPLPPGEHEILIHLELKDGTVLPDKVVRLKVVEPTWSAPAATPDIATPMVTPVATQVRR
ncbi:MAG TPA: hypothetical protein VGR29_12565 [Thermomicrobiales bacterium]|nr:hypothetical protein [Thermomicrobiales bacterium]